MTAADMTATRRRKPWWAASSARAPRPISAAPCTRKGPICRRWPHWCRAGPRPQARVLDLGCGGGHVSYHVAPHVHEVVAYDLSPEMLDVVARAAVERGLGNIATRQGVAELLPFADASFDFVLSRFSAHHWRDFDAGLREAARVLKPGGTAAFVDCISPGPPLLDTFFQASSCCAIPRTCAIIREPNGTPRSSAPGCAWRGRASIGCACIFRSGSKA